MSTSSFTEKHVGTIALIVSIIALFGTLVPQITDFVAKNKPIEEAAAPAGGSAPGGGMPGPGGGMPGMGGPRGGGMGGGGFGGFGPRRPSEEYIAKYKERVALFDEALKTAQGPAALKMRLDRDLAQLMLMRNENGGRAMPGLSEAFLKERYATASDSISKLDKNQAELDYIQALDRMRGDKDAFLNTIEPLKGYPKTPLTQEQLVALLAAEQPVGQP